MFRNPNNPAIIEQATIRHKMIALRFMQYSVAQQEKGVIIGGFQCRRISYDSGYLALSRTPVLWTNVLFFKLTNK